MKLGTSHVVAVIMILLILLSAVYVSYGSSTYSKEVKPDRVYYATSCEIPAGELACGETSTVTIRKTLTKSQQGGGVPGLAIQLLSTNVRATGNVATIEAKTYYKNCTVSSSTLGEDTRLSVPHPVLGEYLITIKNIVPTGGAESVIVEVSRSCYDG